MKRVIYTHQTSGEKLIVKPLDDVSAHIWGPVYTDDIKPLLAGRNPHRYEMSTVQVADLIAEGWL